jgi:ABC-type multidrug transport system fused ATPase/permease subunit
MLRRRLTRWKRSTQERWQTLQSSLDIYQYCGRAVQLVWTTNWRLTLALAVCTLVAGLLPGAVAYVGKLIVDAVIQAAESGAIADRTMALVYLGIEAVLVTLLAGARQGLNLCTSLLRVLLGQTVNMLILKKAQTLPLIYFEDSEFYDKMTRRPTRGVESPVKHGESHLWSDAKHVVAVDLRRFCCCSFLVGRWAF